MNTRDHRSRQALDRTIDAIKQGDFDEARCQLELAASCAPDYAAVYEDLGSLEALAGNPDAAVEQLRKAVSLDPTIATAYKKLARALADAGRHDEIDSVMEKYFDQNEDAALVRATMKSESTCMSMTSCRAISCR